MTPIPSFRFFLLFWLLACCVASPLPAFAHETLRVLAWDGYADADLVAAFEQRFGVEVVVTQINNDDEMWEKISRNNGGDYDVFAANTAELQRYIAKGLSVPLRLDHIPNRAHQMARFRNLDSIPGLTHNGLTYAIPYAYSEMGLIYDRKKIKSIPRSISAMWDPAYRGRVLAYDGSSHSFSIAGMLIGASNPFRLNEQQFKLATQKLIDLRRNVLTFYSSPEEAVKLFVENDVVLVYGNYGTQQVKALRDAGQDIGYVIPEEGALAWLDCWSVTRGAHNRSLAEAWINFMLEYRSSERLTAQHGLANTITPYPGSRQEDKLIWLQPVESFAKRKRLWDRIMSGASEVE